VSIKWYKLVAANKNDYYRHVPFVIGAFYANGEQGVTQDYVEALKWFKLGAETGQTDAQYALGKMYYEGHGIPQNHLEALKWFKLAAEQGNRNAHFQLGVIFMGRSVTPLQAYNLTQEAIIDSTLNTVLAHMWFNLAAAKGVANANTNRDIVAELLSPKALEYAQQLARECLARNYKGC
jgi:TPR repeat protein